MSEDDKTPSDIGISAPHAAHLTDVLRRSGALGDGRWGQPLLDVYYAALVEHGVGGYDRQALKEDYRLSVLWQMHWPVWQAVHNIPPVIWWNNLERILLAVDDLGCGDLL